MGKDPAFLFYPGDYLRDTQCMSEEQQVAYDRMMCEHMRNICISKTKLNFFTKKLNIEEKEYLIDLLKKVDGGYQIEWVALSIEKRRAYSASRRKNRDSKKDNICGSYDFHMENEDENISTIAINSKHFNVIWNKYPNRVGKKVAEKHFKATVKTEEDLNSIEKALDVYLKSERVEKGFVQNGSTWFNNWQDWIDYEEPDSDVFIPIKLNLTPEELE